MRGICCAVLVLCALASSASFQYEKEEFSKCFPRHKSSASGSPDVSTWLPKSRLKFSVDFLKNVLKKSKTGGNFFFSPHSVYQALLLALFISNEQTEKHIKTALQLPSNIGKLDALQAFKMESEFEKMRSSNSSGSYEVKNVNRLFYEQTVEVRKCIRSLFHDELTSMDFKTHPSESAQSINEWVSNQTKYQIKEIISDADISDGAKLVLVNAMYFKGLWASKFLPENTRKEVFYTRHRNTLIPMMRQKGTFKHLVSEKLTSHVIQLPYKAEDVSMFILLPPLVDPHGVEFLLEKLNVDVIAELVEPDFMTERPVELGLPKFTVEHSLDNLVPILQTMGVGDMFDKSADFSSFTGNRTIFFSDAKHKAKVSVDEEGTVAAAATAVLTFRSSRPLEPIKFICNHPFVYFIYDHASQSILFIGVYNTPV